MSRLRHLVDRVRAGTRREIVGSDDGVGVVVDPDDVQAAEQATAADAQQRPGGDVAGRSSQRQPATVPAATGADVTSSGDAPVVAVRPVTVPRGVDIAAAWSWRAVVIAIAAYGLFLLVGYFSPVVVPVVIALLLAALAAPMVDALDDLGLPRGLASALTVVLGLAAISALLTLVGTQVSAQFDDLRVSVTQGLDEVQDWLRDGPFNLSQGQLDSGIEQLQDAISSTGGGGEGGAVVNQLANVGTTVGHVFTGFFIALFTVIFLLYDGKRIWSWVVRLFPRAARDAVDSSGQVAWVSLTAFVRATVLVALVDALGIALTAYFLDVPLALAIGVLVFMGAFVPVVGAFVSGGVACLVALVDQGPYTALGMFAAVIVVQQLESHVLQPFLMGRFVRLHPLAVILAIAAGVVVAGIVGALVAVPLAACANAVVTHLASRQERPVGYTSGAVRVRRV
jgi:predicted PurR-regulated permease PerM